MVGCAWPITDVSLQRTMRETLRLGYYEGSGFTGTPADSSVGARVVRLSGDYDHGVIHRTLRTEVDLIGVWELPLKSWVGFWQCADKLCTVFGPYLAKYVLFVVGDHPVQFFFRAMARAYMNSPLPGGLNEHKYDRIHRLLAVGDPFHYGLNGVETIVKKYLFHFNELWMCIHTSKLTEASPLHRYWHILLVAAEGWRAVRSNAMRVLSASNRRAYPEVCTFLWIHEVCVPFIVNLYSVVYKSGNFDKWHRSVAIFWMLATVFRRKNYDKGLLVWLFNVEYWKRFVPDVYNSFVENFSLIQSVWNERLHRLLRMTTARGNASVLSVQRRAASVFDQRTARFEASYGARKWATYNAESCSAFVELVSLKLLEICTAIAATDAALEKPSPKYESSWLLPRIHGSDHVNDWVVGDRLPPAFNGKVIPPRNGACAWCNSSSGSVEFLLCGHALCRKQECRRVHASTVVNEGGTEENLNDCEICYEYFYLMEKILAERAASAMNRVTFSNNRLDEEQEDESDDDDDEDDNDKKNNSDVKSKPKEAVHETEIKDALSGLRRACGVAAGQAGQVRQRSQR